MRRGIKTKYFIDFFWEFEELSEIPYSETHQVEYIMHHINGFDLWVDYVRDISWDGNKSGWWHRNRHHSDYEYVCPIRPYGLQFEEKV